MNFKKCTAGLLLLSILALPLASCGERQDSPSPAGNSPASPAQPSADGDGAPAAETEAPDELSPLEQRKLVDDELPADDFGARNFTVIGSSSSGGEAYILTEEMNGEGVNDAVYSRNLAVEDRFNAKIAYIDGTDHRTTTTTIANAITSGDNSFDLIQYHVVSNSGNAMKGLYLNWYDIPSVNFDKPWWSDSTVDDLTVNGRAYLAIGDFALTTVGSTYCMFYDKQEAVNYQVEDPYEVVKDGR